MKVYKLEEVISHMKNGINVKQNKNGAGVKLSRIETISDTNFNFDKVGFAELSIDQKSKYKIKKNDILFSHINSLKHLGKTAIYDSNEEIYHGVNLLLIKANDLVHSKYLRYFFIYLRSSGYWIKNGKQAINQASVNQTDIKNIPIPVPSLQEQEKIVERLDKVFENIRNKVDKESNSIELYGKLYKSKLNQIFNNEFMGSGETELGELSEIISGQSPKGEFINDSEGLEFHQGKKAFSDKFLLDSGKRTQYTTKQIPKNTIVMSVRAPVGPVNITQESICIGRGLAGIIPKESNLDFLFYYLDSIKEENTGHIGATINSINRNEIMKIKIPNVSIAKQETIANQIEQILELKNELVSNSREVLTKLNKLKESVLSKEFSYE